MKCFKLEIRAYGGRERERERVYGEDEAIRARVVEVEGMEEIGGEVGDGLQLGFEEKPASPHSSLQLRLVQNVPGLELQTEPRVHHGSTLRASYRQRGVDVAAMYYVVLQATRFLKPPFFG